MGKLLAFDLDGTLVDSIRDLTDALNAGLKENGIRTLSVEEACRLVGHSIPYLCYHATPEDVREAKWENVLSGCNAYYLTHLCDTTRPYTGIAEALAQLRMEGHTLAVVTNKPHVFATLMVDRLFPDGLISYTLGMKPEIPKKPDPAPLELTMKTLGFMAKDAIYIGDSEVDVQFARNTGLKCIACSWGLREREVLVESKPDLLIDAAEELVDAVHQLQGA